MTDEAFKALCNTFGFAPSRALREMIDCARAQEIEACAKVCDAEFWHATQRGGFCCRRGVLDCADAIRARKENT